MIADFLFSGISQLTPTAEKKLTLSLHSLREHQNQQSFLNHMACVYVRKAYVYFHAAVACCVFCSEIFFRGQLQRPNN